MSSTQDPSQIEILNVMRNINSVVEGQRDQHMINTILNFLSKTNLFQRISDEVGYSYMLKETSLKLKYQKYKYGEFLFHQGERGDNLYFVLSGQGSVYIPKEEYEIKTEMILHQRIGQLEADLQKYETNEQKNSVLTQIEIIKSQNQNKNYTEIAKNKNINEEQGLKSEERNNINQIKTDQKQANCADSYIKDEITILALNEKHRHRYFRYSKDFSIYKRVRNEKYLDYFGELAAEEQFNRRMASVVASSTNEDFEVAYISLVDFKIIFENVLEKLYFIQNTLCDQLINCSKKQIINFSYLFGDTIKLERGQIVFSEGAAVNGMFIVRKGSISIKKVTLESKQMLQLGILSQKDIFGHEDAFTPEKIRSIFAVSEGYGTEIAFAKIDDIQDFLYNHKDFEKELKRKSELKINFYKKRVNYVEKVIQDNQLIYNSKEKRMTKVNIEDDQTTIFSKFLLSSKDKVALSKNEKVCIRNSNSTLIQASQILNNSKNQIIDAGNLLRNKNIPAFDSNQQNENKQLIKRSQGEIIQNQEIKKSDSVIQFKGRSNLRTRSLINININQQNLQNEQQSNKLGDQKTLNGGMQLRKDKIVENVNENIMVNTNVDQQNKQNKSIHRQSTLSLHLSTKQNNNSLFFTNNEDIKKQQSDLHNQEHTQSEALMFGKSLQNPPKQISKKLRDAIVGQWNSKPENWTVDMIESQIKINTEKLQINQSNKPLNNIHKIDNSSNNQIKLTYLHNDMDSFEHAKKFVILKRQHKKTQYLHSQQQLSQGQNSVQQFIKQQRQKEQQPSSIPSSPILTIKQNEQLQRGQQEDPFFDPQLSIQRFTRFIQSQPSLRNLDNSSFIESTPLQKLNYVGRSSLNNIYTPIGNSLNPSFTELKPLTFNENNRKLNIIQEKDSSQNKSQLISAKQARSKVFQLRRCCSTIVNPQADDISEHFYGELQTSNIVKNKQQIEEISHQKLREAIKTVANQQSTLSNSQLPQFNQCPHKIIQQSPKLNYQSSQLNQQPPLVNQQYGLVQDKPRIPLITVDKLCLSQDYAENQGQLAKHKDEHEQNIIKNFLDNQREIQSRDSESPQLRLQSNQKYIQQRSDKDEMIFDDKNLKYFFNSQYTQSNGQYSPIIIQKLESVKPQINPSSIYSPLHQKAQISYVQPSLFQQRQDQGEESPQIYQASEKVRKGVQSNNYPKIKPTLSFNNSQSNLSISSLTLNNKIQKNQIAFSSPQKSLVSTSQKFTLTKLNSQNSQNPHSSIQKQINNYNNTLLKNHLLNQIPQTNVITPQNKSKKGCISQFMDKQDELYSPIHHTSLSPNLRKSRVERIQSSNKGLRNTFSTTLSLLNEKEQQLDASLSPKQVHQKSKSQFDIIRLSLNSAYSPKEQQSQVIKQNLLEFSEVNTSKDQKLNQSQAIPFQALHPSFPIQSNTINLFKKSHFQKDEFFKGKLLEKAFPQKNKLKQKESLRDDEQKSPSKCFLNLKKRNNVIVSSKYNNCKFQQIDPEINSILKQKQQIQVIPFQNNSNIPSPTLQPKFISTIEIQELD